MNLANEQKPRYEHSKRMESYLPHGSLALIGAELGLGDPSPTALTATTLNSYVLSSMRSVTAYEGSFKASFV